MIGQTMPSGILRPGRKSFQNGEKYVSLFVTSAEHEWVHDGKAVPAILFKALQL